MNYLAFGITIIAHLSLLGNAEPNFEKHKNTIDYDKIYDIDIQPNFPVKSNTLVNLTINLIENRSLFPGEAFYLNYDNVYVMRFEPLADLTHYLAEYLPFKAKRNFCTKKTVYFEIEFKSTDHNLNLEVAVQRRDINYPKITPIFATQMNIYPHNYQLKIKTNLTNRNIYINTTFFVECEWKDYMTKVFFDPHDFKIIKMDDFEVLVKAVLKADKLGLNQMVVCHSNIDESNDIIIENYMLFNVTEHPINLTKSVTFQQVAYEVYGWSKLVGAIVLLVVVLLVIGLEIFQLCNINDPMEIFDREKKFYKVPY